MADQFYMNNNAQTIWEVLNEEYPNLQITKEQFIHKMSEFNEKEKNIKIAGLKTLFYMNSKFLNTFKQPIQQPIQSSNIKLNIQDQILPNHDVKELITVEELQNDRMTQFEKDMSRKQSEFKDMMSTFIPDLPIFEDKKDEPIGSEMEQLIADTMKQRQFDIERIYSDPSGNNIISNKVISTEKKHISWSNDLDDIAKPSSIFSRLKLREPTTQTVVDDSEDEVSLKDVMKMLEQINSKLDKLFLDK
jgi:hypothetical protein